MVQGCGNCHVTSLGNFFTSASATKHSLLLAKELRLQGNFPQRGLR